MSKDINVNINLKDLPKTAGKVMHRVAPYVPLIFFVIIASVYGFMLLRITMLANAQPDESDVSAQSSQLSPHIDKSAANQLRGLEDNSVNVQTLFDQSRGNPFGE